MGSYSLLQIVGSTIIGGLFLLMLFRFNAVLVEKNQRYNTQGILQNNLNAVSNQINLDLNKIGFCMDKTKAVEIFKDPIVEATNSTFAFKTDIPIDTTNPFGDGTVDIIKYYLGGNIATTTNSRDKKLYRKINSGAPLEMNYGVTNLQFKYYDSFGALLAPSPADLKSIAIIEYKITVEDIYGYKYTYLDADTTNGVLEGENYFMKMSKTRKIAIQNLKNR